MSTVKIQIRGNCQCCGHDQAVVNGTMSKHGYTVDNGWFNGICSGERFAPLQKDRTQLDLILASVAVELTQLAEDVVGLETGRLVPKQAASANWYKAPMIAFADASPIQQAKAVEDAVFGAQRRIRQGESYIKMMTEFAAKVHGTELRTVVLDKPVVQVGSTIKLWGDQYVVEAIVMRRAERAGPSLNGKTIEHVKVIRDGKEVFAPKRCVRLV